ncbi:septum site-determining protein MinC [Pseudalkalibacillus salsuginis]|uniref:septum site-determining protein MinC n=1 Tax=Pseudalkalibacillus salsuginis TaxID=2910972 RepID=UPI001F2AFFC3|nr:septum site-determining protein MinC [Pseudalkalibacillus salsuginis]MCF6408660.1 septum site-determining protein MinC [Pseudalkalibacillus salsuginis]
MAQKQRQKKSNTHYVTIKGTKEGLILHLDDTCSFDQLLEELETKLIHPGTEDSSESPKITVKVKVGKRYLNKPQEEILRNIIYQKKNLIVDMVESDVITREEAEFMKKENEITSVCRMIRSGQILKVQGDLLLVGDVNPGGTVAATGNIFVMGTLKGNVHAGCEGRKSAVITASVLNPTLVRIADQFINEEENDQAYSGECAYLDEEDNTIKFDRLHILHQMRPGLNRL